VNDLDFDELDKAIGGAGGVVPSTDDSVTAPSADSALPAEDPVTPGVNTAAADTLASTPVEEEPVAKPESLSQVDNDPLNDSQDATTEVANAPETPVTSETLSHGPLESPPGDDTVEDVPDTAPGDEAAIAAAPRSQGRFMDMVHKSSDMTVARSSVPPAPVQAPPSGSTPREASDVAPIDAAKEASTTPESTGKPEDDLVNSLSSIDFSQPEPDLDGASTGETVVDTSAEGEPDTKPEVNTDIAVDPLEGFDDDSMPAEAPATGDTAEEPLGSPFIPDAQVEKRPLGGAPTSVDTVESTDVNAALAASEPPTQSIYAPEATAGPAPAVPAKKGGGLIWLLIIAGLIIIGGGGGFAAWFFLLR
jgi:hypothetical protein